MLDGDGDIGVFSRERPTGRWFTSVLRGQFIQRHRHVLSIRSVEIRFVSGANFREVREDDSGDDLGISH